MLNFAHALRTPGLWCRPGLPASCSASKLPMVSRATTRAVHNTPTTAGAVVPLLVGCYTDDHEPLAYYTNHADKGAHVVGLDVADGSLSLLDTVDACVCDAGFSHLFDGYNILKYCAYFVGAALLVYLVLCCTSMHRGTNPTYAAFDAASKTAYFTNENLEDGFIKSFRLSAAGKLTALNSVPVDGNHPCCESTL